ARAVGRRRRGEGGARQARRARSPLPTPRDASRVRGQGSGRKGRRRRGSSWGDVVRGERRRELAPAGAEGGRRRGESGVFGRQRSTVPPRAGRIGEGGARLRACPFAVFVGARAERER